MRDNDTDARRAKPAPIARNKNGLGRRRIFQAAAACGLSILGLFVAALAAHAQDKGAIGISMPTKSVARWIADGDHMSKLLEAEGYRCVPWLEAFHNAAALQ